MKVSISYIGMEPEEFVTWEEHFVSISYIGMEPKYGGKRDERSKKYQSLI